VLLVLYHCAEIFSLPSNRGLFPTGLRVLQIR